MCVIVFGWYIGHIMSYNTLTSLSYFDITACPSLQVLSAPAVEKSETPGRPQHQRVLSSGLQPRSKEPHWSTYLDPSVLSLPRTRPIFEKLEGDSRLSYSLPRLRSSAGQILQHGIRVIQKALDQKRPCTFKIGFSHNPIYRYYNEQFGYFSGKDRFEGLCVLYISHEPTGPAFLEAALIHHFNGDFPAQSLFVDIFLLYMMFAMGCQNYQSCLFALALCIQKKLGSCSGQSGLKNERPGGETIPKADGDDMQGPYCTYFVYRSFQRPPDRKGTPA